MDGFSRVLYLSLVELSMADAFLFYIYVSGRLIRAMLARLEGIAQQSHRTEL